MSILDSVDQIWNAESRMVLIIFKIGNLKQNNEALISLIDIKKYSN